MTGHATPPEELPPGLLEEYLAGMRGTLAALAAVAERLTAARSDREALEILRRETHKIHGSAGAYGFMDASRLAAGMEATAKDWVTHADDQDVDRGSLTRWFVVRLGEMLGLPVPPPAAAAAAPAPTPPARPLPRVGSPPRPSQPASRPSVRIPTPAPAPAPSPTKVSDVPAQAPSRARVPPRAPKPALAKPPPAPPPSPPPRAPAATELPWIVSPDAAEEPALPAPEPPAAEPRPTAATPEPRPSVPVQAEPAPPAAAAAPASAAPEVIYVEDDAALAELLAYGLQARGYRFAAYRNGREALRELLALDVQGTHPLLLLDVDLPALDGYSIFDALQRERPGIYRVVFTTVHGSEEEQLRGLEAGALDYLVKPISLRVAMEKVKRWVGR